MRTYIYDKNTLKEIDCILIDYESFMKEPQKYKENYDETTMICSDYYIAYPKIENGVLREKTILEKVVEDKKVELLQDGEYIEDGEIKTVEKPNSKYLSYTWNRDTFEWELATTKEELMLKRKDLIMKYKELKTEIETLQEFKEEFEPDGSIMLLKLQMQKLKIEIDELLQIIKKM